MCHIYHNWAIIELLEARDALDKAALNRGVLLQVQNPPNQGGGTAYVVLRADTANKK